MAGVFFMVQCFVLTLAEFTIYVLACFAGLYILVAILIFFIQRRLMYFPNSIRAQPNSYGLDSICLLYTSDAADE